VRAERDIYDPAFVKGVFDRCSTGYRWWSQIASFGFVWLWRRQCIKRLPLPATVTPVIADLMAGTGETWRYLLRRHPHLRKIHAIDISSGMVKRAIKRLHALPTNRVEVFEQDVLDDTYTGEQVDAVICTFGLKTFNSEQQEAIAQKVAAMLKPGGVLSFVEASEPKGWILAPIYMTYLRTVLPAIERGFLNGAQDFAMLGTYTRKFQTCDHFADCLRRNGFRIERQSYFFGCATGVTGRKMAGVL
jgi:ubiquinone/menaquinone biosynthesis C-methylase UbiE